MGTALLTRGFHQGLQFRGGLSAALLVDLSCDPLTDLEFLQLGGILGLIFHVQRLAGMPGDRLRAHENCFRGLIDPGDFAGGVKRSAPFTLRRCRTSILGLGSVLVLGVQ